MPEIERINEFLQPRPKGFLVTFQLSAEPDNLWKEAFKMGGIYSAFGLMRALFEGDTIRVEIGRREELGHLRNAVDRCIERANIEAPQ